MKTTNGRGSAPPIRLRDRLRRLVCEVATVCCRVELQGRRQMMIHGCCGIERYHPRELVLRVRDGEVRLLCVRGEQLLCSSYHSEGVEIVGVIHSVELLTDKEEDGAQ